ncbi:hypothetical protein AALB47_11615 [Lachnospiraceae bacterium 54-11]
MDNDKRKLTEKAQGKPTLENPALKPPYSDSFISALSLIIKSNCRTAAKEKTSQSRYFVTPF